MYYLRSFFKKNYLIKYCVRKEKNQDDEFK